MPFHSEESDMTSTWLILPWAKLKEGLEGFVNLDELFWAGALLSVTGEEEFVSWFVSGAHPNRNNNINTVNIFSCNIYKYFEQVCEFEGRTKTAFITGTDA